MLERICDAIRRAYGFERALLARYNAEVDGAKAVVQLGVQWPGDEWLPLDWFPFLRRAAVGRSAVYVRNPRGEVPDYLIDRFRVGEIIAVPLLVERRPIGFLVADRAGKPLGLTEEDLDLLTSIGLVAAVFIEKADEFSALQSLERAKSDFISIASHELRTPIAVVHGITSTLHLRGAELRAEQLVELRSTLYEQTSRLRDLAESLLDLSRIDADAVVMQPERVRPREACETLLRRLAPDRAHEVAVSIPADLEVTTDPEAFDRIVSNLVLNALKYGSPPVVVTADRNGAFRLAVEDRGTGVDPTFVPHLFDRFSRSEGTRRSAGAGLGLSIAQSFAEALGGSIRYEPARPQGSRFVLELPLL